MNAEPYKLANGKTRARAGMGKTPYGITPKKLQLLTQIRNDPQAETASYVRSFFQFTESFVRHARDLAKSGNKDAARNWYRYFTNAQVIKVLHTHNAVESTSLEELKNSLHELGTECHPLDVPNWKTDIQQIRSCLDYIVQNLPRRNLKAKRQNAFTFPKTSFEASISHRKIYKKGKSK